MKKIILTAILFLTHSCATQSPKNIRCMEFYEGPGTDWFSIEKQEEYQTVIADLQNNDYAVSKVELTNSKADLYKQLSELGFSKTNTYLKEKKIDKLNEMGEKIPLIIFSHEDGSVVRVKPMQDMSNKHHPYPHYVLTVRDDDCGDGFDCEKVKLGRFGYIFPKHPSEFKKGVSKQDLNCWGDATHIRLRK